MHISQTSEYAMRAMGQLALQEEGLFLPTASLAEATGIPAHYLSKIMRRMVVAELVSAKKGHSGGFALARPAKEIAMIEVLKAVDHPFKTNHCVFGWNQCDPNAPCPMHHMWSDISDRFEEWARRYSLADVKDLPRR
jgi:Rrf2 family protein